MLKLTVTTTGFILMLILIFVFMFAGMVVNSLILTPLAMLGMVLVAVLYFKILLRHI